MDNKELVGRLVDNKSPFTDEDTETLSGYSESTLQALIDAFETTESVSDGLDPDKAVIDTSVSPAPAVEEVILSEEEQIEALPAALKSLVLKAQAQEIARREHLITALSEAQDVLDSDALTAKDTESLEELSAVLGQVTPPEVDYSPASPSILRENAEDGLAPSPPSLLERITNQGAN